MASEPQATPRKDARVLQARNAPFFGWMPPRYAALARGLVLAIGMAILEALIAFLPTVDTSELPPALGLALPAAVILFQAIVGEIDHRSSQA